MAEAIQANAKICIWPKSIAEKDINEMILVGRTEEEILDIINKNTFEGLTAMVEFTSWRMR